MPEVRVAAPPRAVARVPEAAATGNELEAELVAAAVGAIALAVVRREGGLESVREGEVSVDGALAAVGGGGFVLGAINAAILLRSELGTELGAGVLGAGPLIIGQALVAGALSAVGAGAAVAVGSRYVQLRPLEAV